MSSRFSNRARHWHSQARAQPLPSPWLDQDVGQVGVTGSASYASGTFTVNGEDTFAGNADRYVEDLRARLKVGLANTQFTELEDGRTISIVRQAMPGGGWVATHEDVTERRQAEMKIAHMARHDALTDLPNRVLLRERLSEVLPQVESGEWLAVLYLDLDQFKNVNDTLGHPTGDELLRIVAGRLRGCVRETDTISRVGGDEFSIIQTDITDATDAERLARHISEAITAPYDLHGHLVMVYTSIGIALARDTLRNTSSIQ